MNLVRKNYVVLDVCNLDYTTILNFLNISETDFTSILDSNLHYMYKIVENKNITGIVYYNVISVLNEYKLCEINCYGKSLNMKSAIYDIINDAILNNSVLKLIYKKNNIEIISILKELGFVEDKGIYKITKPLFLVSEEKRCQ